MTIDWWTLGLQAINVLVLVWLLGHFFWRPVAAMIEQRRVTAQKALADAEAKRTEAAAALADIERTRAGFAQERDAILKAAQETAEQAHAARLQEAAKEAAALEAAAKAAIARDKEAAEKAWAERASQSRGRHRPAPGRPPRRSGGAERIPRLAAEGNPRLAACGAAGRGGERRDTRSDQRRRARTGRPAALPQAHRRGFRSRPASRFQGRSAAHRRLGTAWAASRHRQQLACRSHPNPGGHRP